MSCKHKIHQILSAESMKSLTFVHKRFCILLGFFLFCFVFSLFACVFCFIVLAFLINF